MSAAAAIAEAIVGGLTAAGRLLEAERDSNVRLALASMHAPLPDLARDYREAMAGRVSELAHEPDDHDDGGG